MTHNRPWHDRKRAARPRRGAVRLAGLLLVTGSCSTLQVASSDEGALAGAQVSIAIPEAPAAELASAADVAAPPLLTGDTALEANQALPFAGTGAAAPSLRILASATPIASLRAHDCLAQAIYYEARSESEDGQRAVAQVVLNRVRHPAWPNSVCGVVYQGPMRAGGGCQFTFTCDGALRFAPRGEQWLRARRLAGEALEGRVFAPVGLSTFYHANYVMPRWAPRLAKTATIGAHIFYRLPGAGTSAFSSAYAGVEPVARPNPTIVRYGAAGAATIVPEWLAPTPNPNAPVSAAPAPVAARPALVADAVEIEDLQVRPEFRGSGQWRSDAPAAITGR